MYEDGKGGECSSRGHVILVRILSARRTVHLLDSSLTGVKAPVQNLVVKVKDYTAPAHRGQFDDISVCEYDELHYRSAYL